MHVIDDRMLRKNSGLSSPRSYAIGMNTSFGNLGVGRLPRNARSGQRNSNYANPFSSLFVSNTNFRVRFSFSIGRNHHCLVCVTHQTGSPYVRAISPIKAVAGDSFIMHCPFSGYPIEIIRWEKARQELVSSKYANQMDLLRSLAQWQKRSNLPQSIQSNSIFSLSWPICAIMVCGL